MAFERTLESQLRRETQEMTDERVLATMSVDDQPVLQPMGIVHGGVYATMAEGMASEATFRAVYPDGNIAVGMSNQTSFLRPISERHDPRRGSPPPQGADHLGVGGRLHRRRRPPVRPHPRDDRRAAYPRQRLVIGSRRSRPNAFGEIFTPGGAWRRLYSARSTIRMTRFTSSSGSPRSTSSPASRSSST